MAPIRYRTAEADGFKVFYREAGDAATPKLLLLHGFPSAGHMFRELIPLLADNSTWSRRTLRASVSPTCRRAASLATI